MDGSKFREIMHDHTDDNGATYMDGYKTDDPNEEGVVIAVVIKGEPYWRNPDDQFDPYVKEVLAEIKKQHAEEREELKENVRKAVSGVVYTPNAKPRLTFTDGSPLEKKLTIINEAVEKIMKLI